MKDNVKIISSQIELAEKESNGDLRLKMLICPLDVVNGNGVKLDSASINDWVGTLVNQPVQAKINHSGDDFEGHAAKIVTEIGEDGRPHKKMLLGTYSYGTFTDVSVEDNNILATATVWAERYPTVGSIIERRLDNGGVRGSWEISVNESDVSEDGIKTIRNGRFLGFALLGEKVQPAFKDAGILEVAELDENIDEELAAATLTDNVEELSEDVEENEIVIGQEEEVISEEVPAKIAEQPEEQKPAEEQPVVEEEHAEEEPKQEEEPVEEQPAEEEHAEQQESEVSAITDRDLRDGIERAYHAAFSDWPWVCYLFVDEQRALLKTGKCNSELEYESIAYAFDGEDVILTPEGVVKLVVSPLAINEEIERRDGAIAEATAKIAELTAQVAELAPFKEEIDRIRAEKEAEELAEKRNEIRAYLIKTGLVSGDELVSEEIASIVERVDYAAAKSLIADRYIASLDNNGEKAEKASVPVVEKADLNANEHISGRAFVKAYIAKI